MEPNLASRLVESKMVSKFLLAHSTECINLVAEDEERNFGEFLDREQRVKLGLRLGETLVVGRVDQENDAIDLREVVTPETAGCVRNKWVSTYFLKKGRGTEDMAE
jgi:hypothetical protein